MLENALLLAVASTATSEAPRKLPYEEGTLVPPGYHVEDRRRTGYIVLGSIGFGVSWLVTAVATGLDTHWHVKRYGPVPLVGPFLAAATADETSGNTRLGLVAAGVLQARFAAMIPLGIVWKKKMLIRDDVTWTVVPMVAGVAGAWVCASF